MFERKMPIHFEIDAGHSCGHGGKSKDEIGMAQSRARRKTSWFVTKVKGNDHNEI